MQEQLISLATNKCFVGMLEKEWKYHSKESLRQLFYLVELQKWLREKHNIWVIISFGYGVEYNVYRPQSGYAFNMKEPTLNDGTYNTYEEALEDGLIEALKLLPDISIRL